MAGEAVRDGRPRAFDVGDSSPSRTIKLLYRMKKRRDGVRNMVRTSTRRAETSTHGSGVWMSMLESESLSFSGGVKLGSSEAAEVRDGVAEKLLLGVLRAEDFLEDLRIAERSGEVLRGRVMGEGFAALEALERADLGGAIGEDAPGTGGRGLEGGRPMPGRYEEEERE